MVDVQNMNPYSLEYADGPQDVRVEGLHETMSAEKVGGALPCSTLPSLHRLEAFVFGQVDVFREMCFIETDQLWLIFEHQSCAYQVLLER